MEMFRWIEYFKAPPQPQIRFTRPTASFTGLVVDGAIGNENLWNKALSSIRDAVVGKKIGIEIVSPIPIPIIETQVNYVHPAAFKPKYLPTITRCCSLLVNGQEIYKDIGVQVPLLLLDIIMQIDFERLRVLYFAKRKFGNDIFLYVLNRKEKPNIYVVRTIYNETVPPSLAENGADVTDIVYELLSARQEKLEDEIHVLVGYRISGDDVVIASDKESVVWRTNEYGYMESFKVPLVETDLFRKIAAD